jgi:D-3-phosphoglycerate dehydrogenase
MLKSTANTVHVVNHEYADLSIESEILGRAGYEVEEAFGGTADELLGRIRDTVGIICIYAQLNEQLVSRLTACRAISRPGVGYDMIDVAACRRHGIEVSYLPSYGNGEVATHAAAMMLAMHQRLIEHHAQASTGNWNFNHVPPVASLKASTLGIIGLGRIGRAFAERLAPFVGNILVFDPLVPTEELAPPLRAASLEDIYAGADLISLHCPLTKATRHLLGEAAFAQMRRKPLIVNVSRGGLIDTKALVAALDAGTIRAAALDVLEEEPHVDRGLRNRNDVLLTPHVAWRSRESEIEIRTRSAEELARMLRGERPLNPAP